MPSPKQANNESSRQGAARLSRYTAVSNRLEHGENPDDEIHVDQRVERPGILLNSPLVVPTTSKESTSRLRPDQPQSPGAEPILMQPSQSGCMLLVEPLRESDLQPSYADEITDTSNDVRWA